VGSWYIQMNGKNSMPFGSKQYRTYLSRTKY